VGAAILAVGTVLVAALLPGRKARTEADAEAGDREPVRV
jgi:hypothetical protein